MNFVYAVTIPKDTAETAPYTQILKLSYGVITHVQIIIPSGHAGQAHLTLFYQGFQLYPLSRGEDYHGDFSSINFDDRFYIETVPFFLKAVGWNSDTDYDHEFLVIVNMMLPDQLGMGTGYAGLRTVKELAGKTIEV